MVSSSRLGRFVWHPVVRSAVQVVVYAGCLLAGVLAVFLMLTGLELVVSG